MYYVILYFLVYSLVFLFCLLVSDLPACIWILRLKPSFEVLLLIDLPVLTSAKLRLVWSSSWDLVACRQFVFPTWLMVYGLCLVILSHGPDMWRLQDIIVTCSKLIYSYYKSFGSFLDKFSSCFYISFWQVPCSLDRYCRAPLFPLVDNGFQNSCKRGFGNIYSFQTILCPKILSRFFFFFVLT